ncbi:PP2C family protein-serine/threonine phosphatase [Streptomyces marokkonensis]|uniref:PP2C family protein-serine/threonine phosphatase n=1 Tax=Streptomyces marokkonensis TaxID=324855 RepID=UPI001FCB339C|nr:PP2C family protein-serine/threonine phosphatase [Streptomyces marokkonensis]
MSPQPEVVAVRGDTGGATVLGIWRRPWSRALLFCLFPVLLLGVDALTSPEVRLGPLMVAAPTFAAIFCTPACVLVVLGVTVPCAVLAAAANQQLDSGNFPVQIGTLLLISAASVAASAVRVHGERRLAASRWVAEVTQRVLLHPLPRRAGPFDVASLYLAADEEAAVGGDLYGIARCGHSTRVLIGDVQGKGLASLEMVSCVLTSFRRSARHGLPLGETVGEIETAFREEVQEQCVVTDPGIGPAGGPTAESFVTGLLVDLSDDGSVRMVNLGHPAPLLLHEGVVTALEPSVPAPPVGLGDLSADEPVVDTAGLPPGATLLLHTDGVTEARDASGAFYPLAERARSWTDREPDALLAAVHADLRRYASARLVDDVALVALRRSPVPAPDGHAAADGRRARRTPPEAHRAGGGAHPAPLSGLRPPGTPRRAGPGARAVAGTPEGARPGGRAPSGTSRRPP